jgi:hypothetical protein
MVRKSETSLAGSRVNKRFDQLLQAMVTQLVPSEKLAKEVRFGGVLIRHSVALSDQQKRFHRGLPFLGIVVMLTGGVAEGAR